MQREYLRAVGGCEVIDLADARAVRCVEHDECAGAALDAEHAARVTRGG